MPISAPSSTLAQLAVPRGTMERIAREHLGVTTLETRSRDQLDFHDVAVWQVRAALLAAFEAGRRCAAAGDTPASS